MLGCELGQGRVPGQVASRMVPRGRGGARPKASKILLDGCLIRPSLKNFWCGMICPFTHFYSDPHFGHENIIRYCNRPFTNVQHMTSEFISRYNSVVRTQDHVLWLGDCFWAAHLGKTILSLLNGRKSLVRGNHDQQVAKMLAMGFEQVTSRLEFDLAGQHVIASHYPPKLYRPGQVYIDSYWDRRPDPAPDTYYLHGHTHEQGTGEGNRIHVGVDAWDYTPASALAIAAIILCCKTSQI